MAFYEKSLQEVNSLLGQDGYNESDLFYDWWCSSKSLLSKGKSLKKKAEYVISQLGLDPAKVTLTFKNNCPYSGKLFDVFMIDSIDEKRRLWIVPSLGYTSKMGKAELVIIDYETKNIDSFEFTYDNWKTLKQEIKDNKLLRTALHFAFQQYLI
jgi:hypothetical protein